MIRWTRGAELAIFNAKEGGIEEEPELHELVSEK